MSLLLLLLVGIVARSVESKIGRPRGVSPADASFYQVGEHFTCIASSKKIPYSYVNDNYCDCEDGSDEPGTAACENRSFYCDNKGFQPGFIPSSRVDDGICDCCDGSDEDGERIQCQNTCDELGRVMREEQEQKRQKQEEGHKKKEEFIQEAKKRKEEKKMRVDDLMTVKQELIKERDSLEVRKTEAEAPEKEAKEKHEKLWEDTKALKQSEKEKALAEKAFAELDTNKDQHIDTSELMVHEEFDIDADGVVTDEEAKEHLEDLERVGLEDFTEKVWPNIKEIYKSPAFEEEVRQAEKEANLPAGEEEEEGEKEEKEVTEAPPVVAQEQAEAEEEKMPDYDEETKKLIEAADAARLAFKEADDKIRQTENEINDLHKYLDLDLGPDDEYGVLKGSCFEYTDREYTYKFCPFDRASQRPKSGGTETSLGNWGHWDGPSTDKYAAQKYERGQNCWNGPDRSAKIIFHCGTENELTSASEPSRCEYQFDFSTPSGCAKPLPDDFKIGSHDEL